MRFYTKQHKFYCGIDLHARSMYMCILDQEGNIMLHKNSQATPKAFLRAIKHTVKMSSSPLSVCSSGIGSLISAPERLPSSQALHESIRLHHRMHSAL